MNKNQNCAWEGCKEKGTIPQVGMDGQQWANLCVEHAKELDSAIDSLSAPKLLSAWIRAMGGAKKAAERM